MMYDLSNNSRLGIPMIAPVTWEENVAANMDRIPALELFPGLMVIDLYKAYRAGILAGRFEPYNGSDPGDLAVGYIADTTGKRADVVKSFLDAMIKTVNQGKASADILTGKMQTGIAEKVSESIPNITEKAQGVLIPAAIIAGSLVALYLLSFIPRPR